MGGKFVTSMCFYMGQEFGYEVLRVNDTWEEAKAFLLEKLENEKKNGNFSKYGIFKGEEPYFITDNKTYNEKNGDFISFEFSEVDESENAYI